MFNIDLYQNQEKMIISLFIWFGLLRNWYAVCHGMGPISSQPITVEASKGDFCPDLDPTFQIVRIKILP
jgi:hypothetical protein